MAQAHAGFMAGQLTTGRRTTYILVIEDNARLRSVLARYVMLNCEAMQRSCAIYHLGLNGEPRLTFAIDPSHPELGYDHEPASPEFAIFEADSPKRALAWLQQCPTNRLTIVSDVMMPADTEVGLSGLLDGLRQLRLAVNLIFVSSELQSREYLQTMLNSQQAFFVVKGSASWRHLPTALVQQSNRFSYQFIVKPTQVEDVPFHGENIQLHSTSAQYEDGVNQLRAMARTNSNSRQNRGGWWQTCKAWFSRMGTGMNTDARQTRPA